MSRSISIRRWFVNVFHNPVTSRVILVAALGLTMAAWYYSHEAVVDAERDRFELRSGEIATAIEERMSGYERVLWGGVGLHNASNEVSREEWNSYVDTQGLAENWPGVQGIGYATVVPADQLDDHVDSVRAEGFPDYSINPPGPRDEYTAIVYLEPFDWRNQRAFGYDMWSNEVRREAMARARDTGQAATSGAITLVQETDEDVQQGFLTYTPVYRDGGTPSTVEARRAAHVGWVYAPFRMNDLMTGVLGSELDDIAYEIFDGPDVVPEALLYDSDDVFDGRSGGGESHLRLTSQVTMQGRLWTFVFRPGPGFGIGHSDNLPTTIAIGGVVIDLLLFFAISSLGRLNARANELADEKTAELQDTTERLQERSRELEERSTELEAQTTELGRSNAELAQFAHVASHDLQEPLRTMGSYSDLLVEKYGDELGDEAARWLGYIATGSERLSDLVRDILDYSSIGAAPLELAPVPLEEVVDRVVVDMADALGAAGATIDCGPLPTVWGDRSQLERLCQNLISNAVKYRRPDVAPSITVSAEVGEAGSTVSVTDNGIGIEDRYQERVFEIFRRLGSRAEQAGTGVGLALCRKIVGAHGGSIGVDSRAGEGSRFWFTLPLHHPGTDPDPRHDIDRPEPALTSA